MYIDVSIALMLNPIKEHFKLSKAVLSSFNSSSKSLAKYYNKEGTQIATENIVKNYFNKWKTLKLIVKEKSL